MEGAAWRAGEAEPTPDRIALQGSRPSFRKRRKELGDRAAAVFVVLHLHVDLLAGRQRDRPLFSVGA